MKRKLAIYIYFLSLIFILGGACNTGFTRFWLATPFMVIAIIISIFIKKHNAFIATSIFCAIAIIFNVTLEKNPIAFPILINGSVTVLRDGNLITFSDGSGGFFDEGMFNEKSRVNFGKIDIKKLSKGQEFKVTGIIISHPDFSTNISLTTTAGQFSEMNYQPSNQLFTQSIKPNKTIINPIIKFLGNIMYYPMLLIKPIIILQGGYLYLTHNQT